tara:strand:- start:143 stop:352 length:210 start_codon:yes stop_codon:yes gene_type:complete
MTEKRTSYTRTVTISIPKELVKKIDIIASTEERSRSKMIEILLKKEIQIIDISENYPDSISPIKAVAEH